MLENNELKFYKRQILFLGKEFQKKLKNSSVAIVGLGGLGSPVAYYLASAGIGTMKIIDKDIVEFSNLNRQILYTTKDIGKKKARGAENKLRELNPFINIESYPIEVTPDNYKKLLSDVDLIIDCTDGWRNKLLLNDISIKLEKPLIHAGVREFYGQLFFMIPGKTPCLRCILPTKIDEHEPIPIIGVTAGLLGVLEALEAIKFLGGITPNFIGKLLVVDLLTLSFDAIDIENNDECKKRCTQHLEIQ